MARLLEHHALEILRGEDIPVPRFEVVLTPTGAGEATARLGGRAVLKALVPVGGRGKAGAIKTASSPAEAVEQATELLGRTFLNFPVREILVSEAVGVSREFFVSITFDGVTRKPLVLFSTLGGVDVEEIVQKEPGRLLQATIDISVGLESSKAEEIAGLAGLKGETLVETGEILARIYRLFRKLDAEAVEINPLALAGSSRMVALSAALVVDNQALFRHPELEGIADPEQTNGWRPLTPLEKEMRAIDRIDSGSAIRFNEFEGGDIAFMITGGGAGLLALDAITKFGGRPATSFDITPGRVEEKMYLATRAILSRPGLKGLIAGGNITNFIPIDIKVRGVVRALKELGVDAKSFPVVFRFAGPGVEAAKEIASQIPGIEFYDAATSIEDAVRRIVEFTAQQ